MYRESCEILITSGLPFVKRENIQEVWGKHISYGDVERILARCSPGEFFLSFTFFSSRCNKIFHYHKHIIIKYCIM